jgi:hypothetical protein
MNVYLKMAIFYFIIVCVFLLLAWYSYQTSKVLDAFYNGFHGMVEHAEEIRAEAEKKREESASESGKQEI